MYFKVVPGLTLTTEICCLVIVSLYSMIAAAGGVGGGSVYASALMAFNAPAHTAIPMSKTIIFAGAFVLLLFNIQSKSASEPEKPGVMWDLVIFIENATIVGAVVGAVINAILPEWLLILSEFVFFTHQGITEMMKGIKNVKADRQKFAGKKHVAMEDIMKAETVVQEKITKETTSTSINPVQVPEQNPEILHGDEVEVNTEVKPAPKITRFSHWRYVSKPRLFIFLFSVVLSTTCTILRAFVTKCSAIYWSLLGINFLIGIVAIYLHNKLLMKSIAKKEENVLTGSKNNTFSTPSMTVKYSIIGFLSGAIAAVMGIGGGIIATPLMLSMGIPPSVTRMASSTMIAFTSFSSMIQYMVLGQIDLQEVWVFMLVVGILFPIGFYASAPVIRIVRSTSVINVTMAAGVLISGIFVAIQGVKIIIKMVDTHVIDGFVNICK
ncbi:Sulfite_exporter TauE-SafE [Hexamita inflata]|uniref:Sulfite_exporter TauE-SafE n=1 Tax=Hexamita inflata TaxID=28002 RepID=A0ABP1HWE8_9EUKA